MHIKENRQIIRNESYLKFKTRLISKKFNRVKYFYLSLSHESSIMNVLNHPLLVYFKESIQTKSHLYIITELVKGKDLFEYIKEHGVLS